MKHLTGKFVFAATMISMLLVSAYGQSRHSVQATDGEGSILSVTAWRTDSKPDPIKLENIFLYENGTEQKIKNLTFDPSPSKIVLLVDNSQTLAIEPETLKKAVMEFAYEIFDGDQLFVLAYDEKAEIIQEWTDDAKKMEASLSTFRKKGNPYLFDALDSTVREVLRPLIPGTRKTAVVVFGDGLDRGSTTHFDKILSTLQNENITVYFLQLPDRTGGAYRRDQPKATAVVTQLTEGTGGKIFPMEEAQGAAKFICDELRRNRYLLSYAPLNTSTYDARRVFLVADEGISIRSKNAQPPNIK
ncbi:MAG TPA: VWA domain-containing protein [Pyrinomonadaceae bacterium]|nr:VWA domain-containing protein [Pyrinomonadaceae bacterium]